MFSCFVDCYSGVGLIVLFLGLICFFIHGRSI